MITRIWHGRTSVENADRYLNFLLEEGTKDYRSNDGNITAKVWRNIDDEHCHFWTVTEWRDIDSIKRFAGTDYQQAKYYPFDNTALLDFEPRVAHYESYDVSSQKIRNHIQRLEQLYHGGNWVGESFEEKLRDVKEEDAFSVATPGLHSVAEIVWHCIYWRTVTLERLRGGKNKYRDDTSEDYNFLPLQELKIKGWHAIKNELADTQRRLLNLLTDKTDLFLTNEYQPGYSFDFLLDGTIHHDYYHLGQVGLVLKILKLQKIT